MPSSLGIVASGEDVLNDAVLWLDASLSSVSGGKLTNLGKGGSALNAQFGSTTSTDSNDPLLLTHTGTNYLYLPGVASNHASTPDSAALDITGDLDLRVRVAMDDWTPATNMVLISKLFGVGTSSYEFALLSTGVLRLTFSADGTTLNNRDSTVATGIADGSVKYIRAVLDVDNGASGHDVKLYTSDDGVTWSQLGATVTTAGVTSVFASTANLFVGSRSDTGSPAAGQFFRAQVCSGIGGTSVFDAVFTSGITSGAQTTFTESSSNAATVTINRATSGRKAVAVTRPTLLFGTDDYLAGPNTATLKFGASQDFTLLFVGRTWDVSSGTYMSLIGNRQNSVPAASGVEICLNHRAGLSGSTVGIITAPFDTADLSGVAGRLDVFAFTRDVNGARSFRNNSATVYILPAGYYGDTGGSDFRIGARYTATSAYADIEFVAAAVFRRALTANEIATIVARYT